LTAASAVTPGAHSLYLSIFDQGGNGDEGDHFYDSAVFLDNFVVGHASNLKVQCAEGAAPKVYNLTLAPLTATNPVGTPHTVTATLTEVKNGSDPVEGGAILFSTSGVNSVSGTGTTNSAGGASYTYAGANVGDDAITACYDIDSSSTCDEGEPFATVMKTWIAVSAPPSEDPGDGGLPITGRATGLIAGVGALVLAIGITGYVVLRRRRVRFVAE
jgi:hypothetical protein